MVGNHPRRSRGEPLRVEFPTWAACYVWIPPQGGGTPPLALEHQERVGWKYEPHLIISETNTKPPHNSPPPNTTGQQPCHPGAGSHPRASKLPACRLITRNLYSPLIRPAQCVTVYGARWLDLLPTAGALQRGAVGVGSGGAGVHPNPTGEG